MDAVNATQIVNPKDAYTAIATDPKFASLLEQVPAKHPTQLYEAFCYIFVFILFFLYWKLKKENTLAIFLVCF
jgi:prolipoprotein diacylglyceryltransferase